MDIMDKALTMMKEGDKHIKLSNSTDIIVILGLTGSGKSTLSLLLTSDNSKLTAVKMGAGSYLIIDENKKISSPNNALISQTIIPELMIDPTTGAAFYDMPGFKDTRSSSMEIATTFFMKKVFNHAERIKLVFVVDHNIVSPTSSRTEFPDLLRHATNSIKNVDKFRDSIGMVFTKVQNTYEKVNKVLTLIPDDKMIETVAGYLRRNFHEENERLTQEMIDLVNIALTKQGGVHTRMCLFRSPDEEGSLSNITIAQESKDNINRMIHQNLKYTPSNGEDFGYTISERTEMDIHDMLQNVTQHLSQKLNVLTDKIIQHLEDEENKNVNIETLLFKYTTASDGLSRIVDNENNSTEIFKSIETFLKELNISESEQDSLDVERLADNLKLIRVVSPKQNIDRSSRLIMAPVEVNQRLLQTLKNWFAFLVTLENEISILGRIRDPPKKYNEIKENLAAVERNELKMTGENLAEFLDDISSGKKYIFGYDLIKGVEINPKRAQILSKLLDSILTLKPTFTCLGSNTLRITALYLKLSETLVSPIECPLGIQTIEIFVGKKLWIDTDLNRIEGNTNLIVVSPYWEILGDKKFQLDGHPGPRHSESAAANGSDATQQLAATGNGEDGGNGADGLPGLPGSNGGNFYGIAHEIVNAKGLTITVNGGLGGPGQKGGNGGNGANGEDANRDSAKFRKANGFRWEGLTRITEYTYYGGSGGRGGNGGRGGVGGLGGYAGNIIILKLKKSENFRTSAKDGTVGSNGDSGVGGLSGMPGKNCISEFHHYLNMDEFGELDIQNEWNNLPCSHDEAHSPVRNENNLGLNSEKRKSPIVKSNPKFEHVLTDYKNYANELRQQPYHVKFPTTLIDLPNDYAIRNRRDAHESPSITINRFSLGDVARSSVYLLDLVLRKCTKVKFQYQYNQSNNVDKFIDPINLTVKFHRLLNELRGSNEEEFDPLRMIEQLKLLMATNNCYDKIHQFLYDRVRDFDWGSNMSVHHLQGRIRQLLEE